MNKEKAIKILQDCIDYMKSCTDEEYEEYEKYVIGDDEVMNELDFDHKIYLATKDGLC